MDSDSQKAPGIASATDGNGDRAAGTVPDDSAAGASEIEVASKAAVIESVVTEQAVDPSTERDGRSDGADQAGDAAEVVEIPAPSDAEHGYIVDRRQRLSIGIPVAIYAAVAGTIAGLMPADLREAVFPFSILPVVVVGVYNANMLVRRTTDKAQAIWRCQRLATILIIPATLVFGISGILQSRAWVAVATLFGAAAGAVFVAEFWVAVQYYRGSNRGVLEALDVIIVIACGLALAGYVLIVPLFLAGLERSAPFALLPPAAIGFLVGIVFLILSVHDRKVTAEYIFAGAGVLALLLGVLETVSVLRGYGGANAWLRSGMWGLSIGLISIVPLWAPVQQEGEHDEYRGAWQAPRFYLPYWALGALPLLTALAITGHKTWGPAYAFIWTFVVFGIVVARQIFTVRENLALFTELARRDRDRDELLARTIRATEEERSRLARDLHDGPVQDLSALMLRMGRAAERSTTAPEVLLGDLRDRLGDQVASIRETIAVLRPPLLDKAGLSKALEAEIEGAFARETTQVEYSGVEILGITADQELQLFRIAQEAIRNARMHSRAEKVTVTLAESEDGRVDLEVRDNGVGFVQGGAIRPVARGHIGLASMRERAILAGADLQILSTPGAGTIVRTSLEGTPRRAR